MKHLKRFNENIDTQELKEFVEDCLVYLLDEGFIIDVEPAFKEPGSYDVVLSIKGVGPNWDKLSDHYIPFLQLLSKKYHLSDANKFIEDKQVKVGSNYSGTTYYSYDEVLNDKVKETRINFIVVRVTDKI